MSFSSSSSSPSVLYERVWEVSAVVVAQRSGGRVTWKRVSG